MLKWAKEVLKIEKEDIFSSEEVVSAAWSSVHRLKKNSEVYYLKQVPEKINLEAKIINTLRDSFGANVPDIIAQNLNLNCFIMSDEGFSLRGVLNGEFDKDLVIRSASEFIELQQTISNELEIFFKLGVPDYRLDKLTNLFSDILDNKELLLLDGTSLEEIKLLKKLLPKIAKLCDKLSKFNIKETMVQCDFNDNNVLYDKSKDKISFIDLGEVAISHPLFSLLNFLFQIKKYHADNINPYMISEIQDDCLNKFLNFESRVNIDSALKITQTLWFVYEAICINRLIEACDINSIMEYQKGKLSNTLRFAIGALEG